MAEYQTVAASEDVPEGEARSFAVGDEEIAIARVDGNLYAFSDICTHRGCNLANGGEIEGLNIECECHGSVFSMETGEVVSPPATEPIAIFPVQEEDGRIQVEA